MKKTIAEVKEFFETGDTPTGAHFVDLIDTLNDVSVTDKTYAELMTLITASGLIAGAKYRITDFKTLRVNETWDFGNLEPLVVTANSVNSLALEAYSEQFPTDKIHYSVALKQKYDNSLGTYAGTHFGSIIYREDTVLDVVCYFDFRNYWSRVFETSAGSGIFNRYLQHTPGSTSYAHKPIFDTTTYDSNGIYSVWIGDQHANFVPIVFANYATKVNIGSTQDCLLFGNSCSDTSIDPCSVVEIDGFCGGLILQGSSTCKAYSGGSVASVVVGSGSNVIIDGDLNNSHVMSGYATGTLTGPLSNALLGYPVTTAPPVTINLSTYGLGMFVNATYATYADYVADTGSPYNSVSEITANENSAGELGWYIRNIISGSSTWVSGTVLPDMPNITNPSYAVGADGGKVYFITGSIAFPAVSLGLPGCFGDSISYVKFAPNETMYKIGDTITIISDNDPLYINAPNRQGDIEELNFGLGQGFRIFNQSPYVWTKVAAADWTLTSPDTFENFNANYSGWGNRVEANVDGVKQRFSLSKEQYNRLVPLETAVPCTINGADTILNIDCSAGTVFIPDPNGTTVISTFSFTNIPAGVGGTTTGPAYSMTLILEHPSTSEWQITWPTEFRWSGGTVPTLTTNVGATDIFVFTTYNGGLSWFAHTAGLDMKQVA